MKRWLSFILVFALTFQQITPSLGTHKQDDFDPNNNNNVPTTVVNLAREESSISSHGFTEDASDAASTFSESRIEKRGQKLNQIHTLKFSFKKGFLEITPETYQSILKHTSIYDAAFENYDRGICLRGWSGQDNIEGLAQLLNHFNMLKSIKCRKNTLDNKTFLNVLRSVIQHYEALETLDLNDANLSDKEVLKLLKVLQNPIALKTLNIKESILISETLNSIKNKYPNLEELVTKSKPPKYWLSSWFNHAIAIGIGAIVIGATYGGYQFWNASTKTSDILAGLTAPPCNPSFLRNGICYACDYGTQPLTHYNLTYWPHEGCPPELAPDLVYSLRGESEEDYRNYLVQLQNATFLEDQKDIIARCAEGLENVTASALARIGVKTNFNKDKNKSSVATFRFLLKQEEPLHSIKSRNCIYEVTKNRQPQEGSITAHIIYPSRFKVLNKQDILDALNKVRNNTLSVEEFVVFVKSDPTLTSLDLQGAQIGDEDTKALAITLKELTTITKLNLHYNQIGDKGAKVLTPALRGLTSLHHLSLSHNQIRDEGAKALAIALKGLTSLARLDLGDNKIGAAGVISLAPSLKDLASLTALILDSNQIGDAGVTALAPSLKDLTSLTTLSLIDNEFRDNGIKTLAPALQTLTSLQSLNLAWNPIGDEGAIALASSLQPLASLEGLNLFFNWIGDEGAKALAPTLKALTSLKHLNLNGNQIKDEGAKALATVLKELTSLEYLGLYKNWIRDEGAKALATALQGLTSLKSLSLDSNVIRNSGKNALDDLKRSRPSLNLSYNKQGPTSKQKTDDDIIEALRKVQAKTLSVQDFAVFINNNPTLTNVDLGCKQESFSTLRGLTIILYTNNIGDEGAIAMAEAIRENKTLTTVDLNHNEIGDEGAKAIAAAIKENKTLTTVDLYGNKIGDEGAKAIAAALKENKTLTTVDLNHNEIGDEGAKAIAEAIKENKTLTTVNLSYNKIGDEGAQTLAAALKENKTLTTVNLSYNKIGDEGAQTLAAALKENKTLTTVDLYGNKVGDEGRKTLEDLKRSRPSLDLKY